MNVLIWPLEHAQSLALPLVEILDHQPSAWAAAGDRIPWSCTTLPAPPPPFSQSPLCSSWAIPCGAGRGGVPTLLDYLPNHQPALGWLLSIFLLLLPHPGGGSCCCLGVKCRLCLGDKEQSGSSVSCLSLAPPGICEEGLPGLAWELLLPPPPTTMFSLGLKGILDLKNH